MRGLSPYKRYISEGKCGHCGAEPLVTKALGVICLEKSRLAAQAGRDKQREAGLCSTKGCQNAPVSSGRCEACNERHKQSRKKSYAAKAEAHICVQSGCHEPAKEGCKLCQEHIDLFSANTSATYRKQREAGLCGYIACDQPPDRPDGAFCVKHRQLEKEKHLQLRLDALNAYGGPHCAWEGCTVDDLDMLHIDHIDGGGNQHRKKEGTGTGRAFYQWLKNNGYPPGFRVLCANHNAKAHHDSRRNKEFSHASS